MKGKKNSEEVVDKYDGKSRSKKNDNEDRRPKK